METPTVLGPEDAAAYLALRTQMLSDAPWAFLGSPGNDFATTVEEMRRSLSRPEQATLGVRGPADPTRLIASATVLREPHIKTRHRAWIMAVYCDPAFRSQGLGRRVVAGAIAHARRWPGVSRVSLSASVRSHEAIALYESLGFVRWGIEPDAIRLGAESLDEAHYTLEL